MNNKIRLLGLANKEMATDIEFFAFYLKKYSEIEKVSEQEICSELNCSIEAYRKLALCRAPSAHSNEFIHRLNNVSQFTGIPIISLNKIIKRVDSVIALSGSKNISHLMAARDKDKPEDSNHNDNADS